MKTTIQVLVVVASAVLLTGCYESVEVTVHEPGEYKGTPDPLLQADGESRASALEQRFNLVQTDR